MKRPSKIKNRRHWRRTHSFSEIDITQLARSTISDKVSQILKEFIESSDKSAFLENLNKSTSQEKVDEIRENLFLRIRKYISEFSESLKLINTTTIGADGSVYIGQNRTRVDSIRFNVQCSQPSNVEFLDDSKLSEIEAAIFLEKITSVAALDKETGKVYVMAKPSRHHHLLHAYYERYQDTIKSGDFVQGFFTNANRFIDRIEGLALAEVNGQFNRTRPANEYELFSEDLW